MTVNTNDLGVLGNLATALGLFTPAGDPNPDWFGDPEASLTTMLENDDQRNALIAFVDEAMGGADRTTDPTGVIWLPIVHLDDPDLTIAMTIDDQPADGVHIGVGLSVRTTAPASNTSLSVPLFRTKKHGGPNVTTPLLLGSPGGRIRIATSITIDASPPTPGVAHLGAVGIDVDIPTSTSDTQEPIFGLSLTSFQLPGATQPRDIRVAADGLDELDDAVLDLILSLVKAQADSAAPTSPIAQIAGLLGLRSSDAIPDFPIMQIPTQGVHAIATWLYGIMTTPASRSDWVGYIAGLVGGTHVGDNVLIHFVSGVDLTVGLRVDTGPTGNARLTPTLGVEFGATNARIEARADLVTIDLVTGSAIAFPQFGVWAAAGRPGSGNRILDVTSPTVAQADTLRIGFALDVQRRLVFVLAADGVTLGSHSYATLDLTSPDAIMDAVGNTVSDIANQLLANCGSALSVVRLLIGLDAPAGVTAVTLPALMSNPVGAVRGYWHDLAVAPPGAMTTVLAAVRDAIADATAAVMSIRGTGTQLDPWCVPLIGPLELEASVDGTVLAVKLAASTSVDDLGQRCTVVETRLAATLAEIDLSGNSSANLLPGVEASLSARERGVNPPRVTLALGDGSTLTASGVGLRLGWTPANGLVTGVDAPNLTLSIGSVSLPIALPVIAADGTVTLSAQEWEGVEALVGYLGELIGGFLGDVVQALGWSPEVLSAGGEDTTAARLRLADVMTDPKTAIEHWLPQMLLSDVGPQALSFIADLFAGSGQNHGFLSGTGHPDDPYRLPMADGLPNLALWFPPEGLERRIVAAPEALQRWRPGDPGFSPDALAAGIAAEAGVADDVRELIEGRDVAGGLAAIAQRWVGSDGRIVPPPTDPTGVTVEHTGFAAGQLLDNLDIEDLTGRVPITTVYIQLGSNAWPNAPADHKVDLSTPGLDATMFTLPAAATGDWYVALGGRADCRSASSTTDGTPEQAERLARFFAVLATVSTDIAIVAVAGAGHAARLAAQSQAAVTDLITLGTPLAPISLTAINTQPTADALRLLYRLLPPPLVVDSSDPDAEREDDDLALGRALITSMMELVDKADPSTDLRPPVVTPDDPRAGLTINSVFGVVTDSQVSRAITAIIAAGLAERARARAETPLPPPTGVQAGLRFVLPTTTSGTLAVNGDALLTLFAYDNTTGIDTTRHLRVRLRITDRLGWLSSTSDLELRMVTADVSVPLDNTSHGEATITLHDARVFGQSWERLIIGNVGDSVPVLPEARVLLSVAIQRLTSDTAGTASVALAQLLRALGIIATNGGVVGDAVDQLIHDPGGLLRQRLAIAESDMSTAMSTLLGPLGASIDLAARSIHLSGGSDSAGRFGWHADVTLSPSAVTGQIRFGATVPSQPAGGLNLIVDLNPLHVTLQWHQPGGATDSATLWPNPEAAPLARMLAKAGPSLGGQVGLELMRRADDTARPIIDAVLDSLGLLGGSIGDSDRPIRPLAGLLADPEGWFRSADSLAANPAKIQELFDAMRPLIGVGGAPGSPINLANGVALSVTADGPGARLTLDVDPAVWAAPGGITGRLAAGLGLTLTVAPSGPPTFGLDVHAGLTGAPSGRRAVHVLLNGSSAQVFLRPTSGSDIPLIPFAGLGALAAAAEAALPFLLDELAAIPGTVGNLIQAVGDALALRSGMPKKFDGAALHAWSLDPVGALTSAVPSIVATGLTNIAPLIDSFTPAAITVTANSNSITLAHTNVSLAWSPATGAVTLIGDNLPIPGIDHASFKLTINAAGINEITVTAGPANIDAGGVPLRPFFTAAAGLSPAGGRRIAIGLAVDDTHRFAARWLIDSQQFALVASDGTITTAVEVTDPAAVALRLVEVITDVVAAMAMSQTAVQQLLDTSVGATTVRNLMRGVVLTDVNNPTTLIAGVFDPSTLLDRLHKLFSNLADASLSITVEGLAISFTKIDGVIGLQAGLTNRFALISGDVSLWLENDDSWIDGNPAGNGGLFVGFLPDTLPLKFTPSLTVNGVGLRIGKSSGPLLDFGITLESIALHTFLKVDLTGLAGWGVQLQFSNLAVSTSGAGGNNGIAQGMLRDTGSTPPKPAFSPALAIQKHGNNPVSVTLRAGDGDGPWWIAIQKGFGPLYLEQIGFGVTMPQGRVERISLLMDGSVSMFGLTCAVDDLQITYLVTNGDFFNPNNWAVDLAGLAVSANMAGVTIAGGLLKQTTDKGIEYLGMLLGRFGVYGITIFGGYGEGQQDGQKFTAFFAVGAVIGPIGGPPAFFLTGIGGGFGINRRLVVPTDLSRFGDYPLIQALDIAAQPQDPMTQLRALGQYFPMQKGTFWFAAGLSFNSFALVDGIAVVAVQIGDGLDISLLGLARMALPRPQVALVSIEIALLVRFSSSEGVLWVQGQLTDNSWLLYPDIKLTGGFAYVIWFKGEHKGEFVLTLGGYHPEFHRDGYPVVPRLGLRWSIGDAIVIKAGSYFALTSEAIMAGGDFEASAHFGPAWAEVKFGAHGIVYFDPFHYHVNAYARIAAGVTIDTWIFGEITISISLGARIDVTGPDFHGTATFEVGPIELTVEFGGSDKAQLQPLSADAFISKYLEAGDGGANAHAVITSFGALPAKAENATPDGSASKPFIVVVEFGLTFTSTVPATTVTRTLAAAGATTNHAPSRALGVAPMIVSNVQPTLTLTWNRDGATQPFPFTASPRPFGSFPVGVWGPPQDLSNPKVPKAEMVEALNELDLAARAAVSAPGPEIPYYQVEIGKRKPLPFSRRASDVANVKAQAAAVDALISEPVSVQVAFAKAKTFLSATASPTALASLRGERQAPPLLGTLTEGLQTDPNTVIPDIGAAMPTKVYDHFVDPPVVVGMLPGMNTDIRVAASTRTTVEGSSNAWRGSPPTLASVDAERSRSIATKLVLKEPDVVSTGRQGTVIANVSVPPSAIAHAASAIVARTGGPGFGQLQTFTTGLTARRRTASQVAGTSLSKGQLAVLKLPNAHADAAIGGDRPNLGVSGTPARIILLGHGGSILSDRIVGAGLSPAGQNDNSVVIVQGTERIVAMGQGAMNGQSPDAGLIGWHAGMQLPYVGWSTGIAPGCVVQSAGEPLRLHRERVEAGWVSGAELARGVSTVTTTFAEAPTSVVVILDDPAAFGNQVDGRQLLLGLDGASRVRDAAGTERPPVLLVMENRSVLAYDIVPDGDKSVVVTIASQHGWSLVGVMGSASLNANGAIAFISAHGLDAALRPFALGAATNEVSQLQWRGAIRTDAQRRQAKALALGRPLARTKTPVKKAKTTTRRHDAS
jgi:large repetitive protein